MLVWLKNLLPRLEAISKSLDQQELFIDQPWIFTDESGNRHQYIFMRPNELVLSVNGSVILGTWKYISAARSLLIDTTVEKLLLNHAFIDEGVLILKKDGTTDIPFILVNERVIPDLNLEDYLKRKERSIGAVKGVSLESGETIHVSSKDQGELKGDSKTQKSEPEDHDTTFIVVFFIIVLALGIIAKIMADS
ncbi:hypothetical protein L0U88_00130 [Flavihumibacter sp. RY-1]|uniref:PH (Pleckstrin Homology) domain-containing protein n=1 Tax=Flavihumibacter fluminis TaxID=2909236 RepID=A0ABS9BD74_9BACT|nr:hypothetical protein [Flavihumibacter fluminis]MCF1713032.1 hypothetical protein [Flavihumibacter fluminis]